MGQRDFSAVDRRIRYLEQELYTYDKWLRDPSGAKDISGQASMAINAQQHQEELEQLMYLRALVSRPVTMQAWQIALFSASLLIAFLIAALSLWLTVTS